MTTLPALLDRSRGRFDVKVPRDAKLDPRGTWAVLDESMPMPPFDPELWQRLRSLATQVNGRRKNWEPWSVKVGRRGRERAEVQLDMGYSSRTIQVHCTRCEGEAICPHLIAIALAAGFADEGTRARMQTPAWQQFLAALDAPDASADRGRRPPDARPGWLRFVLHRNGDGAALLGRLAAVWYVRLSASGKRGLKPKPFKSLERLDRDVTGLSAGERLIVERLDDMNALEDDGPHGYRSYRYWDDEEDPREQVRERMVAEIFAALGDVRELALDDDTPLRWDPTPWRTTLCATDGPEGSLALRWQARPTARFDVGPGYVVVDGALRPVAADMPARLLHLLDVDPPPVPAEQVSAFVTALSGAPLTAISVEAEVLPVVQGAPEPRLALAADGERLLVGLRFGYGATECGPDDPGRLFDAFAESPTLIDRDREAEREHWRRLGALIPELPPAPAPLTLAGDDAFHLLAHLDALDGFEIATDRSLDLRRWQSVGSLSAAARLSADLDWFDLEVDFEVAGRTLGRAAVLASWRSGRRYVRLDDGAIAELPSAWLAQHGETLDELADVRGRKARIGLFAAPMVGDLLDDVGLDAEAARAHAARLAALAERIQRFDRIPERATPDGLRATLRDYQHRGFRWMRALAELGLAGVLADDMGLGKTVQTLTTLLDAHGGDADARPSLVVAPTSVIHNWVQEAARFAPGLRVALHHGPQRGDPPTDVDVVITSYALLRIDAEALHGIEWRYAVLDEAQHIKNPASKVARAARGLRAAHRLALSGTPLENHLAELWSLFEFLMPGFFGSRRTFRQRYVEPIGQTDDEALRADALDRLRRRIRPFVLRRLKHEVAAELPPRQEQVLSCELTGAERRLYDAVKQTYRESVLEAVDEVGVQRATIRILEALTRLRQAACDPSLLPFPEARGFTDSAKRARLREVLAELAEEGHRALVFSQWPSLLKRVRFDLDGLGLDHLYLDGKTRKRADLQTRWNAPDGPPVFLISLKAGGTGLNLIGADVVIHLDPWWNPQTEQQATDRAHRIGQTKPVMVYKLVARETVEEKILELQARKRALFEAAVDGDRATVDGLTRDDLVAVFGPS